MFLTTLRKRSLVRVAASVRLGSVLTSYAARHWLGRVSLVIQGRPNPAVRLCLHPLRRGTPNRPFAAPAKSDDRRTHTMRTKCHFAACARMTAMRFQAQLTCQFDTQSSIAVGSVHRGQQEPREAPAQSCILSTVALQRRMLHGVLQ